MGRLAYEETHIQVDRISIRLRPTLRAATRLHAEFGGLDRLIQAIMQGSVSAIASVIRECSIEPSELPRFLGALEGAPLKRIIDVIGEPILAHVIALSGFDSDSDASEADKAPASRITIEDYHRQLFRIATGWLGWEPELAWNSTANEIREAYKGRVDMLRAIFGGEDKSDRAKLSLDEKFALTMAGLRTKRVSAGAA